MATKANKQMANCWRNCKKSILFYFKTNLQWNLRISTCWLFNDSVFCTRSDWSPNKIVIALYTKWFIQKKTHSKEPFLSSMIKVRDVDFNWNCCPFANWLDLLILCLVLLSAANNLCDWFRFQVVRFVVSAVIGWCVSGWGDCLLHLFLHEDLEWSEIYEVWNH